MPYSDPAKQRAARAASAQRRRERNPEGERERERLKKVQQRLLRLAERSLGWADHSRTCPTCVATLGVGSGDSPIVSRRVSAVQRPYIFKRALWRAASVTRSSLIGDPEVSDPMVRRLRWFLEALCSEGQGLLLPLLTAAGRAAAPGTAPIYVGRHADVGNHEEQLAALREHGRDRLRGEGLTQESDGRVVGVQSVGLYIGREDDEDPTEPSYARWGRWGQLEDPYYLDKPASLEDEFQEWAWYEHRTSSVDDRLTGMQEVRRCLAVAMQLSHALLALPAPARRVAQRIRRWGLLGVDDCWVSLETLLGGLLSPQGVNAGLRLLRAAQLLDEDAAPGQLTWYVISAPDENPNS